MKERGVEREFEELSSKIARLESLRDQLDALDTKGFETEERLIRSKLKDVSSISTIERDLRALQDKISAKVHHTHHLHGRVHAKEKQDIDSIKRRINELRTLIKKKQHVSVKKQLTKQEVAFVHDIPQLKSELTKLTGAFSKHTSRPNVHIDSGVGVLVDSRFDEFISLLKAELSERLKERELSIDKTLKEDLHTREAAFMHKYHEIAEEFKQKYDERVKHDLAHEIKNRFTRELHRKLSEERTRLVHGILRDHAARLARDRAHLASTMNRAYQEKQKHLEHALSEERSKLEAAFKRKQSSLSKQLARAEERAHAHEKSHTSFVSAIERERSALSKARQTLQTSMAEERKKLLDEHRSREAHATKEVVLLKKHLSKDYESEKKKRLGQAKAQLARRFANLDQTYAHRLRRLDEQKELLERKSKKLAALQASRTLLFQKKKEAQLALDSSRKAHEQHLREVEQRLRKQYEEKREAHTRLIEKRTALIRKQFAAQLHTRLSSVRKEHESHIASELRKREQVLRREMEQAYHIRLQKELAKREAMLQERKRAIEQHVLAKVKTLLR